VLLSQCKNDIQKFLGKLNYLRRFIFNLSGKISAFAPILQLKNETKFTWGVDQQCAFDDIKKYLSSPLVIKPPMAGNVSNGRQGTHHYILEQAPHQCRNEVFFY
jgi:hypothetical protein